MGLLNEGASQANGKGRASTYLGTTCATCAADTSSLFVTGQKSTG